MGCRSGRGAFGFALAVVSMACIFGLAQPAATLLEPLEVSPEDARFFPVEIFMGVDASEAEITAVRDSVAQRNEVTRFAYVDQDEALRIFRGVFANDPALIEGVTAEQLPASFRLDLSPGVEPATVAAEFELLSGVDEAIYPGDPDANSTCEDIDLTRIKDDLEAFMALNATKPEILAVRQVLRRAPAVRSFRFLDHDDALREFQRIFADDPDLLAGAEAADLPVSFRVRLNNTRPTDQLAERLARLRGVEEVAQPRRAVEADVRLCATLGTPFTAV